jgi:hypothetical protein
MDIAVVALAVVWLALAGGAAVYQFWWLWAILAALGIWLSLPLVEECRSAFYAVSSRHAAKVLRDALDAKRKSSPGEIS